MPGKLKEALKKNFDKHFVTFEGLSGSFTSEEEVNIAKSVLNPVISADYKSKDEKFINVRNAYAKLAEIFSDGAKDEYVHGLAVETENRIDDLKKAYDSYLKGKEYSNDPEYRSVLRLKNEISGLSVESGVIAEMDELLQKSQETIERNNKGELGKNMQLDEFYQSFFRNHTVRIPLSSKESEEFEKKESKSLLQLEEGRAATEGKKKYIDAILKRYNQVIEVEKNLHSMEEKLAGMRHFGYDYPKEVVDKLEELKQEKEVKRLGAVTKAMDDDIDEFYDLEKQVESFAKDRKTFRKFYEKVQKNNNYLSTPEGQKEYVDIQDYYSKKLSSEKGTQQDYYAQNIGAYTKYFAKLTVKAKDNLKDRIDEVNETLGKIYDIRNNKIDEIDKIKNAFFDKFDELGDISGKYGNLMLNENELQAELVQENFDSNALENNLQHSNRLIKTSRENIKNNIDGKIEFMKHYLAGISEYTGIKIEIENGIQNIKDMDVDYKGKVTKVYDELGTERIRNWSRRLKEVKSRTFSKNSDEFQAMYDCVDSINKKLNDPYAHENYKFSQEYVNDMERLNELAKAYSIAKGGAKRSTTQGQARLDIAHEIMGNNTRIKSITQELSTYSITEEQKNQLLSDMNNALKETEEKFHNFCQKCNKTLGIRKLQSEKPGEILKDDELESFSKNPPTEQELDDLAGKELNRQNRFDLIGVSKEKQEEIKTSLSKRYDKFEKAIRYDIELVKKDPLFKSFMKMKNEKSVGKALSLGISSEDKEKLINAEIKKLDKDLVECVKKPDKEKISVDELNILKVTMPIKMNSGTTKSKGAVTKESGSFSKK